MCIRDRAYAKKYKLKYQEERSYDEEYMEKLNKDDLWDKQSTYEEFMWGMEKLNDYKSDMTEKLTSSMALSLVFIMIISMGLTSIEESLNYYDFTRMLPWSKKREFLMKVGVALVFGLALFIINILMAVSYTHLQAKDEKEESKENTDKSLEEKIKAERNAGNMVATGVVRVFNHNEMIAYQKLNPKMLPDMGE